MLGDFGLGNGQLERPMSTTGWHLPSAVWLDGSGKAIEFELGDQLKGPTVGLLEKFLKLRNGNTTAILRFAREHGVLGVLPYGTEKLSELTVSTRQRIRYLHPDQPIVPPPRTFQAFNPDIFLRDQEHVGRYTFEAIELWQFWAEQFTRALHVVAKLRQCEIPPAKEWPSTAEPPSTEAPTAWMEFIISSRRESSKNPWQELLVYLNQEVGRWIDAAGIRLVQNPLRNRLELYTPWLYSGLVLQIASAIVGSTGFAVCSSCSSPYAPARQPARNKRSYCEDCKKQSGRDATRAYRDRRRVKLN